MKKILVPTDFSSLSRSAALYAIDMAKEVKAELALVSVIEIDHSSAKLMNWKKLQEQMTRDAEKESERFLKELQPYLSGVGLSYKTLFGSPIEKIILEYATDQAVDLIVTGTRGASGLKAAVLGSNTAALINRSQIPVLAVPGEVKFQGFDRIALATDMVDLDDRAKTVISFAKPFHSHIDVLHVTEVQRDQRLTDELQVSLKQMTGYNKIALHVVPGHDVTTTLNQYVVDHGADLLVMFTHELGLFEKLFGKGHTREMAFHSEVPLLSFKS